ncbi:hypothetical protein HZA98_04885 [Candidatus Woesearchaeota archaeon]|nr:hypothetical protein [Candidatus Woesearchaeota archaeon]
MIPLNLDPETRKVFNKEQGIRNLENYFSFRNESPEEALKTRPYLANRAIALLDEIQELTGLEYVFLHIQGGPRGGSYCVLREKSYEPSNVVHSTLGSYNKAYFEKFLKENII